MDTKESGYQSVKEGNGMKVKVIVEAIGEFDDSYSKEDVQLILKDALYVAVEDDEFETVKFEFEIDESSRTPQEG